MFGGFFLQLGGIPDAVRNCALDARRVVAGLKITQLGDTQFLFRFADVFQASKVLYEGRRWLDGNFLKIEEWAGRLVVKILAFPVILWR